MIKKWKLQSIRPIMEDRVIQAIYICESDPKPWIKYYDIEGSHIPTEIIIEDDNTTDIS